MAEDYKIVGFAGQGTYNCAHIIDVNGKKEILRIALLRLESDPHGSNMIKRGLHIVHVLQNYAQHVGPSLLLETKKYELTNSLSAATEARICNTLKKKFTKVMFQKYEFALQHLEYLAGGPFQRPSFEFDKQKHNFTQEELDFSCFSLIWFFRTTNKLFGMRHRDLKEDNVILRILPEPQLFMFLRNNAEKIVFKSRIVPVVIDYDFASVNETTTVADRKNVGTRDFAPPSALLVDLYNYMSIQLPTEKEQSTDQENSYDWWSIGILLFQVILQPYIAFLMKSVFNREKNLFADGASVLFCSAESKETWQCQEPHIFQIFAGMAYGCCAKAVVTNFAALTDKQTFFPANFPPSFVELMTRVLNESETVKQLTEFYDRKIPEHLRNVLFELFMYKNMLTNFNPEQWFKQTSFDHDDIKVANMYSDDMPQNKVFGHPFLQFKI